MFRVAATLVFASVAIAGCGQQKQLVVSDAWVRLAAVDGRPAAGYFTITGGSVDTALTSVSTNAAARTELHESRMTHGGGMAMDSLSSVPVAAGKRVVFAPGAKHAMLFEVSPTTKPGGTLTFTFTFADGSRLDQKARVVGAADPAPTGAN
ncbi:copper chaperone PCu(A)C [Sphingomonas sp.]|jgi:copper(I)-binding protein|uniref:copper chaperone PCu(A)C n=1 Tax=Sphingomonas sp. TaxID=28214 RepID=UPI002608E035|nr:copper chaperone PCu(A)C [Sphingomonas sp.]MDF2495735.1 copper chaperone PCu(A)C [Sphingomonas sp.]